MGGVTGASLEPMWVTAVEITYFQYALSANRLQGAVEILICGEKKGFFRPHTIFIFYENSISQNTDVTFANQISRHVGKILLITLICMTE